MVRYSMILPVSRSIYERAPALDSSVRSVKSFCDSLQAASLFAKFLGDLLGSISPEPKADRWPSEEDYAPPLPPWRITASAGSNFLLTEIGFPANMYVRNH
jgi:hypothetical protein